LTKVPSLSCHLVISAFIRNGFQVIRQKGSHIRLEKTSPDGLIKITVPAHRPIKRSTLQLIIKDAGLSIDEFLELL